MNKPVIDRSALRRHVQEIERQYPLTIVGFLPASFTAQLRGGEGIAFLAEKAQGLSMLDLARAQVALSERLAHPVAIVLRSGLDQGRRTEADRLVAAL
jgi:hypothetical protein